MSFDRWLETVIEAEAYRFYVARKLKEGHQLEKFFLADPKTRLLSVTMTGFIVDQYYMGRKDVLRVSTLIHEHVARTDPDFHLGTIEIARSIGIKDQVVIGSIVRSHIVEKEKDETHSRLVKNMPVPMLYKLAKTTVPMSIGHKGMRNYHRKLIRERMHELPESKLVYEYNKYHLEFMYVLKASKMPEDERRQLVSKLSSHRLTQRHLALRKHRSNLDMVRQLLEEGLSDGLILDRNFYSIKNDPKVNDVWIEAVRKYATQYDVVMYAKSIVKRSSEDTALDIIKAKVKDVPPSYMLRMGMEMSRSGYQRLAEYAYNYAVEKSKQVLDRLNFNYVLVIDRSASMKGRPIRSAVMIASLLLPRATEVLAFSSDVWVERYNTPLELLKNTETYTSTNLAVAVAEAKKYLLNGSAQAIILITDEQENGARHANEEIKDEPVMVINPTPYQAHAISLRRNAILVPAATPEAVSASLNILNLYTQSSKEINIKELAENLVKL